MNGGPRILLGVTADVSLTLMAGFPEFLHGEGWEVDVVCSPGARLDALAGSAGIRTHALSMAREPSPVHDVRALRDWIRLLRRVRPAVVSIGTPKAGLLGMIAARLTRVPRRVYVLRGLRLETASGLQRRILTVLERLACLCSTEVLSVSESLRRRAIELRLVSESKITVLGSGSSNGVDIAAFEAARPSAEEVAALRAEHGLTSDVPIIGFVGRLTHDKGIAELATARRMLSDRGAAHQLLVVGSVDDGQDERIVDELLSGKETAVVTGFVADPKPYYSLIDVLCLPSLREGFPNVVLEAAAAGKPAVTTDATGAVDSVIDGVTGSIVPAGSAAALAAALERLVRDPDERARLGAAAQERARREFDRPLVWGRLSAFYASSTPIQPRDRTRA